jgi:superfamily II helicase
VGCDDEVQDSVYERRPSNLEVLLCMVSNWAENQKVIVAMVSSRGVEEENTAYGGQGVLGPCFVPGALAEVHSGRWGG